MERPCVFDPCYAPPAYACCTQTLSVKNAQGNLISTVDMPAGCCTGGCCATNFYAKVNPSPSPNPDPNPDADPDPNPNPNPNPTPSPKPLTPRMRAATSSTRCVRRYAGLSLAAAATCARPRMPTQASNPRLAGRVPGRSATHTRASLASDSCCNEAFDIDVYGPDGKYVNTSSFVFPGWNCGALHGHCVSAAAYALHLHCVCAHTHTYTYDICI